LSDQRRLQRGLDRIRNRVKDEEAISSQRLANATEGVPIASESAEFEPRDQAEATAGVVLTLRERFRLIFGGRVQIVCTLASEFEMGRVRAHVRYLKAPGKLTLRWRQWRSKPGTLEALTIEKAND